MILASLLGVACVLGPWCANAPQGTPDSALGAVQAGAQGANGSDSGSGADPARSYALLIGCSEYPYLREARPESYEDEIRLEGPANDVALFAKCLERTLGVRPEDITALSGWGDDESTRPTGKNIAAAFKALIDRVGEGDRAYVYFSGHGAQVPSSAEDGELDGLDEVFLPADVKTAPGGGARIPGALSDDRIGRWVDKLVERGASAWLVFDTCHSGTMLRGKADGVRLRGLDSDLLGMSDAPAAKPARRTGRRKSSQSASLPPGVVGFYGAQSFGRAPEMSLPPDASNAVTHGLFTYLLVREIERSRGQASYRALIDRVVSAYQAFPYFGTVPMAEGDLQRPIFGGSAGDPQLLVLDEGKRGMRLNRGRFDGFREGVELLLTPIGGGEAVVARISELELFDARVTFDEQAAVAQAPDAYTAEVQSWPTGEFARPVAIIGQSGARIALADLPERAALRLKGLAGLVRFDAADPDFSIEQIGEPEALRFNIIPRTASGAPAHLELTLDQAVARLRHLAAIDNLRRVFDGPWIEGGARDVDVKVERRRGRGKPELLAPGARLEPGDEIRITLVKSNPGIYDVAVFYVDAHGEDVRLFPGPGKSSRIPADVTGEIELVDWTGILDDPIGPEGIFLIATPRKPSDRIIERTELVRGSSRTRGAGGADPLGEMLDVASGRGALRGSSVKSRANQPTIGRFMGWETNWASLVAPEWPRRGTISLEARPSPASAVLEEQRFEPFRPAARAALVRSAAVRGVTRDLLFLGDERVEQVWIDFDGANSSSSDVGALAADIEAFGPEVCVHFYPGRTVVYYDSDGDGTLDLAHEDADGDGLAETRARLVEKGAWEVRTDLVLPLLSQSFSSPASRSTQDARQANTKRLAVFRSND